MVFGVGFGVFVGGIATLNRWCPDFAIQAKDYLTGVFTERSRLDPKFGDDAPRPEPALTAAATDTGSSIRIDRTKSHEDVAPRFLWPEATTMFSLGFPQAELLYVTAAQTRGLPMPKPHCAFLDKHYGLKLQDLERLTCIQADPEKPGIVIITTRQRVDAPSLLQFSSLRAESMERLDEYPYYSFTNHQGETCGLVAIDDHNLVAGNPELIHNCLLKKPAAGATIAALWPDFSRKALGAFLWTVKVDNALQEQLKSMAGKEELDLNAVQSFAVRYGTAGNLCECFAMRSEKASQEGFATAASSCLRSMLAMLSSQIETRVQHGSSSRETPAINVSRNVASAVLKKGEEFVSLFLEGFYRPPASDQSPLQPLAKARTLAHSFNLACGLGAPEAQRVRTVEEALEALQRGMTGSGRGAGMEFHIQAMEADELQVIRNFLTFADGYLACRPNLDAIPESVRGLIEEGAERLNAETVISLCAPPSGEKVVRIKNLPAYVRQCLARIKSSRGSMALFGMPQLTDDEIAGVLKYIQQDQTGKLTWKPGELSFNEWQAKADPGALHDASTLASMSGAARAAGCAHLAKAKDVEDAISMLMRGVKGAGQFSTTTFRCKELTPEEIHAAAAFLQLENGSLKLKSE